MSTFISLDAQLNQLFLKGKMAVEAEGGTTGEEQAKQARQQLLNKVKPSWDYMTKEFNIRQLHYQLGPGSLSFLRVHKPNKFGDRMDDLRFTIVDTNAEKKARFGFETGRIYSGLRGVSPIWANHPETNEKVYVGAVEVGTSFKQILPIFTDIFNVNIAVLLSKAHINNKMWSEYIDEYFKLNPDINYYLESTTSEYTKNILSYISITDSFKADNVKLIKKGDQYLSIYYFPLRDYRAQKNEALPPSGFILMWEDVSSLVESFERGFIVNIVFFIIGFILIEIGLIWIFNRESKLSVAEHEASTDGLTGLFNRRYYDDVLKIESERSRRFSQPLSLIICDLDYFKSYNDAYGHQQGDECLKVVAKVLNTQAKRSSDIAVRYGGEEFVIILPNTTLEAAVTIAKNINKAIYSLSIAHKNSRIASCVTITLGVACTDNLEQNCDLFTTADKNLYLAKNSGRNKIQPEVSPKN
ncbi:diguanylate cyclase [uncultured Psychromonas sp.]|uniref:sensor domain-containing diguanylate cyclase n=1 Tax=uncultured Psychromonas sp. TaxID=173974 RepID=UPI0026397AF2|nr:diguanylate cyclase [uncultured Psychromonas sp.]